MRTGEQIRSIVENAFHPLRCVAEVWDYEHKFRFRVFDPNNQPLVSFPEEIVASLQDDTHLLSVITDARRRIEQKGYSLDPWKYPPT